MLNYKTLSKPFYAVLLAVLESSYLAPVLIFVTMKLRDRYPHLQNPAVVKAMVLRSVYASMALENQTVSMERLEALYAQTEPALGPTPGGATAR